MAEARHITVNVILPVPGGGQLFLDQFHQWGPSRCSKWVFAPYMDAVDQVHGTLGHPENEVQHEPVYDVHGITRVYSL